MSARARVLWAALTLALASVGSPGAAGAEAPPGDGRIAPAVRDEIAALGPGEMATVIVHLAPQADLSSISGSTWGQRLERVIRALRKFARETQGPVKDALEAERAMGLVEDFQPFWVFNGLSVTATAEVIEELAARPDVAEITPNEAILAPAATAGAAPEPNVALVGAPDLWDLGFRGEGVVVASMDTGVDLYHPDLVNQWRGGANSWFDPNGEHPTTPVDVNGHGTWTMGVMVGRDSGGTAVGMAPDARWIAVKIFDDRGVATVAGIHAGFQWLLDPDGDPGTADAPSVVNNSWASQVGGCDLEFEPDLQALRAAGIPAVFAAGNGGPDPSTSRSPANNPSAVAVGATDTSDVIYPPSSRGPSACEGKAVFPDMVAPGVDVHTTDLFDGYLDVSGTSMAAPHVVGALALLLDAFPGLPVDDQEAALTGSAVDLGPPGPDDDFGHGRLDVPAAYDWLVGAQRTPVLHLSLDGGGPYAVGSLTDVAGEDIVTFYGDGFDTLFDGSDVGLAGLDVDAFAVLGPGRVLLSLSEPASIGGLGKVDDSDVLVFEASSLGEVTAGSFGVYLDGSDVGLRAAVEDVDAVEVLPDGRVLISTAGRVAVRGALGTGHDLLALDPVSLGPDTLGTWSVHFDGSDVGLTERSEGIDGVTVSTSGALYLSVEGTFSVGSLTGDGTTVAVCVPTSLGDVTGCDFSSGLYFDGSVWGLGIADVDAIDLPS